MAHNEAKMRNQLDEEECSNEDVDPGEEDSIIELGQIAVLGSSRTSLRTKTDIASSRRSLATSKRSLAASKRSLVGSKQPFNKFNALVDNDAVVTAPIYKELVTEKLVEGEKQATLGGAEELEGETQVDVLPWPFSPRCNACYGFICDHKAHLISLVSVMFFCMASIMLRYAKWLIGSDHSFIRLSFLN